MVAPSTFSAFGISSSTHLRIKNNMALFYTGPDRELEFILHVINSLKIISKLLNN